MMMHFGLIVCLIFWGAGCATRSSLAPEGRPFSIDLDAFAFANELVWTYKFDEDGKVTHEKNVPSPEYTHHCFVVARAALQFFNHARFVPGEKLTPESYRKLIREVMDRPPRGSTPTEKRISFPGFDSLRSFSEAHENLIKEEAGPATQSYFQRGHWRMVMPFPRQQQSRTAERLQKKLGVHGVPVVHVVRFPQLSINHALVVIDVAPHEEGWSFQIYDPNSPGEPRELIFNEKQGTFFYPANNYFSGGKVNVYEIYHHLCY